MQTIAMNATLKSAVQVAIATALLLLVPLLAMQFTDDVNWTAMDFIVAGALLFGAGLAYVLVARKASNLAYRTGAGIAVLSALMLIWVNLAVGIIGSENNSANLMYLGVIAVEIIGALIARFTPTGMARTLFSTSAAQSLVAVIALAFGLGAAEPPGRWGILILNGFFVALFAASGLLFRRAAQVSANVVVRE